MIIAPSILSADFCHLGNAVDEVSGGESCAEHRWIHVDVMDGAFVPNITIGQPVVRSLRKHTKLQLDVHLMVQNPERYVADFVAAGADIVSIHVEATPHVHRTLSMIKDADKQCGLAINPGTSIETLIPSLHLVDLIVVMSVNPGFGGQQFIPETYRRIRKIKALCKEHLSDKVNQPLIEIDGGVSKQNARQLKDAGADVLVAGSAIFGNGLETVKKNIDAIVHAAS